jgi:hypothetical protein
MVSMSPEVYGPYVVTGRHRRVLYKQVLRGLYGMLATALLWYMHFKQDLEEQGYTFNPPMILVSRTKLSRTRDNTQCNSMSDDLTCSHKDPKVNDEFEQWLNKMYGKHGKVTTMNYLPCSSQVIPPQLQRPHIYLQKARVKNWIRNEQKSFILLLPKDCSPVNEHVLISVDF